MEVGNIKKYIQKYICFFPKKKRIRVSTFFSGRLCSGKETISKFWTNKFAAY
jgi:hypothetical protein